jgi:hypothetical protein
MSPRPVRKSSAVAFCRICDIEVTVGARGAFADDHPQPETVALRGTVKGFVDCAGSGLPVVWRLAAPVDGEPVEAS